MNPQGLSWCLVLLLLVACIVLSATDTVVTVVAQVITISETDANLFRPLASFRYDYYSFKLSSLGYPYDVSIRIRTLSSTTKCIIWYFRGMRFVLGKPSFVLSPRYQYLHHQAFQHVNRRWFNYPTTCLFQQHTYRYLIIFYIAELTGDAEKWWANHHWFLEAVTTDKWIRRNPTRMNQRKARANLWMDGIAYSNGCIM